MKGLYLIIGLIFSFSVFGQEKSIGCGGGLQHVYFNKGEFELDDFDKKYLDTVAMFLRENKEVTLKLIGHSDSKGDSKYNYKLSKKRAKSVANYLNQIEIKKKRLKLSYYGESNLLNLCSEGVECTEELHQVNRRVELVYVFQEE